MDELIKVTEQNGQRLVSARDLHEFLEVGTPFRKWIERMFEYGFEESIDFERSDIFVRGLSAKDYALTIDCAKEIAMLQRNEKGKQARLYFIEIEKKSMRPLTSAEQLLQNAQLLVEQERRISEHDDRINLLEAKVAVRPDYFTVAGYGTLLGIPVGLSLAAKIGRQASSICNKKGIKTETIPDPRFGKVKTYPTSILKEVFDSVSLDTPT